MMSIYALLAVLSGPSQVQQINAGIALQDCSDCPTIKPIAGAESAQKLPALLMTVYPITWRQYMVAVQRANCVLPINIDGKAVDVSKGTVADDFPLTGVTLDDFSCYINWLTKASGQSYRLPTSAEWLAAAHTGPSAMQNWGFEDRGRSAERWHDDPRDAVRRGMVRPVGLGKPNRDGIYDLEGNEAEVMSEPRPGNPKYCSKYGTRYCRGILVLGNSAPDGSQRYDEPGYALQGYPSLSVGFRLVRSVGPAAPSQEQRK